MTEASHEEYEDAADYFQGLFNDEENKPGEGVFVEVCHLEKGICENERYYPASILKDDSKRMGLGKVGAYVGTRISWRMGSWHATLVLGDGG